MNITTIKRQEITHLTTRRRTQAHFDGNRTFMAEQFDVCQGHTLCAVPNSTDPARIFPSGTQLEILEHRRDHRQKRYLCTYLVVRAPNGMECDLLASDIPRYCE